MSVDMDKVGVMAAYSDPLCVCACALFSVYEGSSFIYTELHTHTHNGVSPMLYFIIFFFFIYFPDRASQYIYLNINQRDALNFIISLFHASTCFEHMCSSSGGQNCTIQPLVSSHL